jgi:membrane-associated phospholipid phosphatase
VGIVQVVRLALMIVMDRPRPPVADWATMASGMALPSGHTTTSAMVAALFVVALGRRRPPRVRFAAGVTAAVLWAIGVGVTRVYLGVHWPTDVVARLGPGGRAHPPGPLSGQADRPALSSGAAPVSQRHRVVSN